MKSNVQNLRLFAFSRATRSGMAIISNNSTPTAAIISRFLPSFFHSFLDYGVRNYGIHRIAAELDAIWLPKSTSTTTIVLQFKCRFFPIQIFSAHNFTFSFVRCTDLSDLTRNLKQC